MLKNIAVIEIEKHGKKFQLQLTESTTFGELFDVSMELRQFAINGINDIAKKDVPKEEKPVEEV